MPNLIKDYDVIGFDADHCLVKYKLKEFLTLLIEIELSELIEMGYPDQVRDFFLQDKALEMCLNGAIFDIENGTILKLAEGQEVVRAMKGYRALTQKEIN